MTMLHFGMVRWLAPVLLVAACSRASDESESRRWQTPPPPKDIPIPTALSIDIKVDGDQRPAITSTTLAGAKPDFADDEHKAWMIPTLIPDAAQLGTEVEAVSPAGVSVTFKTQAALEPVLFLTRRGEVIVAAIDPKEPFPRYHGQGGRLKRAGDPLPRVVPVSRIEITRAKH